MRLLPKVQPEIAKPCAFAQTIQPRCGWERQEGYPSFPPICVSHKSNPGIFSPTSVFLSRSNTTTPCNPANTAGSTTFRSQKEPLLTTALRRTGPACCNTNWC